MKTVTHPENFTAWRQLARSFLLEEVPPHEILWQEKYPLPQRGTERVRSADSGDQRQLSEDAREAEDSRGNCPAENREENQD